MESAGQYLAQMLTKTALLLAAYLAPIREVFVIVMAFWAVDLMLGILASKNRHVPRSSRRARKSVKKLGGYFMVILLAFLIEKLLVTDWLVPHRFVAAYLCTVELVSILENLAIITEHPTFVSLIKLIRGKASTDNVINEIIHEKNDHYPAYSGPRDELRRPASVASGAASDRHGDCDRTGAGHGGSGQA